MIDRALIIAAPLAATPAARALIDTLLKSVRAGQTLARAFAQSQQRFPPYYVSMIEAGEAGGSLPSALSRLAELQQRSLEIHERVRSALIYPGLLMGVMLFTIVVLLTFVLPRFEQLFAESTATLPWSTQAVLAGGRFLSTWWWLVLLCALLAVVGFVFWKRSPAGHKQFDKWLVTTRFTLQLPVTLNTARVFRTLSTLLTNGLPLPTALRVARGTVANQHILGALERVAREVQAGAALSQALANTQVFPAAIVQLSRVGEETGNLDHMLLSASQILEEEMQLKLGRLLTLVVPLLTIIMGLLVAGLIGSVLIGLLSINDLAF
jgi:general secretion pathway protein F